MCRAALSQQRQREGLRDGLLLLRAQVNDLLARVDRARGRLGGTP